MIDRPTLLERRIKAEGALLTLEREQGVALLDGGALDPAPIAALKAELAAIEAAERESHRRDGVVQAGQQAAGRAQAAKEAGEALEAYSAAVVGCESAAKAMATNLKAMEAAAVTLRKSFLVMSRRLPVTLEASAIRTTLSRLLAGELTGIDRTCGFGQLSWPSVDVRPDWTQHIDKWIKPAVDAAIEKELAE